MGCCCSKANEEGKKKKLLAGEHPHDVPMSADLKNFDEFMNGKRPDGKSRRCTDVLCLLMIVGYFYLLIFHVGSFSNISLVYFIFRLSVGSW